MNQNIKQGIKILATIVVLAIAGFIITHSWLQAIAGAAIGFTVFSYIVNSIRDLLASKVIHQTYVDMIDEMTKQLIAVVPCAYCSKENAVVFRMDARNEFECEHCHKKNLLIIDASAAQISTPLINATSITEPSKNESTIS